MMPLSITATVTPAPFQPYWRAMVGVDGGVGIVERRGHGPVRRYVFHVGIVFEVGQRARWHRVDDTVDQFQIALQPAAPLGHIEVIPGGGRACVADDDGDLLVRRKRSQVPRNFAAGGESEGRGQEERNSYFSYVHG